MSDTITITTTNRDLWGSFFDMKLVGIKQVMPLEKKHQGEQRVYKIVIHIASEIAIGLFVAWLSEQLKNHPEGITQIENKAITQDHGQITNVIMEHVTINNHYGKESPEHVRVVKEKP